MPSTIRLNIYSQYDSKSSKSLNNSIEKMIIKLSCFYYALVRISYSNSHWQRKNQQVYIFHTHMDFKSNLSHMAFRAHLRRSIVMRYIVGCSSGFTPLNWVLWSFSGVYSNIICKLGIFCIYCFLNLDVNRIFFGIFELKGVFFVHLSWASTTPERYDLAIYLWKGLGSLTNAISQICCKLLLMFSQSALK